MNAYEKLKERFEKITDISNAAAILAKDSQVFMPKNSGPDRTRQMIALAEIAHSLIKAPEVGQWLDEAEKAGASLPAEDKRNLTLMRREWVHAASLPDDLASEIARLDSEGERLHTELRKSGDWSKIKDWYAHSFEVMRAAGQAKKDKLGASSAYEALLDSFSPGLSVATVDREFGALEKALPALIREAVQKQEQAPAPLPLQGTFPWAQQEELCRRLTKALGFDFTKGRMDMVDGHPSCGGSASDVRFTTDCDENNFLEAVYSTVHETGHALYEQNTPEKLRYQPLGGSMGMALHESQSRIIEIQACHTPEFFKYLEKEARAVFNRPDDPALSAKNLELLVNRANPSFIRVQADELTYPAHIILRYKLEKAVVEGTLSVDDLPKAWNDGIKTLLGITPPDPSQGCMQDVHWPTGAVGYFPAYTLGDMGAAQLFAAACRAKPEIRPELANGNFTPLREWLRDNVHSKGSLLTTDELFTAATGEKLNARHYLNHLSNRYLGKDWQQAPAANTNAPEKAKRPGR